MRQINLVQMCWREPDLALVATEPDMQLANVTEYIYVDWGTSFAIAHETDLSVPPRPVMRVDTPGLAHRSLLSRGGAAYLPKRLVHEDLSSGRLYPVGDEPVLTRALYLIHSMAWTESEHASAAVNIIDTVVS